jgi:hypothetical protein
MPEIAKGMNQAPKYAAVDLPGGFGLRQKPVRGCERQAAVDLIALEDIQERPRVSSLR